MILSKTKQTMTGRASAHWLLPLVRISYAGIEEALKDEAEKPYLSAVPSLSRHPSVANYPTVDLATLKEITLELRALFGLSFPETS